MWDSEYSNVNDFWVMNQCVLCLLWIDVDSTTNDHVRLAVGEIEKVVVVDIANIAKG